MKDKEIKNLINAAKYFLNKVDDVENSDEFRGVFVSAHIHGVIYNGKNWRKERGRLIKAIENYENI